MTTGDDLKNLGMDLIQAAHRASENAGPRMFAVLMEFVEADLDFTADDIRDAFKGDLGMQWAMKKKPNLLPAVIGKASQKGLIEAVGVAKPSRASRHGNRNLVWRGTAIGRAA